MKLLIYVGNWAPAVGGVETVTMDLARGLTNYRDAADTSPIDVVVATRTPAGDMNDAALPFRVVRRPGLWALLLLMRDAELVHLAGPMLLPLMIGLVLRRPLVIEHHGFQAICPNGLLFYEPRAVPCSGHFMAGRHRECLRCNAARGRFRSALMWLLTFARRWLCGRAQINIVPTSWLGMQLRLPRMETVHHGLPATAVPSSESSVETLNFVFLGRLVSTKGVQVLLEAVRRLKCEGLRFRLKIVGDGPDRGSLEGFARQHQLGHEVVFLGRLPDEAVEKELRDAHAVVMPSLGGEVFGLVALENMLRGKLVIVSDIGALAEVVGDAGLICPTGDVEAWAASMRQAICNPELRANLARKARQRAIEHFSPEQMIAGHLQVYRRVVREAGLSISQCARRPSADV